MAAKNVIPLRVTAQGVGRDDQAREFLRIVRLEAYDWRAVDLAEEAGVSPATIYAFRSGRTVWPRPRTLFPILEALGYRIKLEKV